MVQDLGSIKTLQDKRDKALEMLEAAIMARDNKAHGKDHENSRNILKLDEKVRECEERLRVLQKQVNESPCPPNAHVADILPSRIALFCNNV